MQTRKRNSQRTTESRRPLVRFLWYVPVCCLGLISLGCNQGYQLADVSGQVTLDGEPLANARIVLEPLLPSGNQSREVRGPLSSGKTDEEGRFVLETEDGQRGAVVGQNRVRFSTLTMDADFSGIIPKFVTLHKESLPAHYNVQSEMVFEVPDEGTDQANFALKSK